MRRVLRPGRRDLRRRLADDDRDLGPILEQDLARVALLRLAVHVDVDRSLRRAVGADAFGVEPNAPLDEELPELVRRRLRRLRVQNPEVRMRMQRRDADLGALRDSAVGERPVLQLALLHLRIGRVDADPGRDLDCRPSTKTSRCECTWYCRCSFTSGTRPARRASFIGSFGAGHVGVLAALAGTATMAARSRRPSTRRTSHTVPR